MSWKSNEYNFFGLEIKFDEEPRLGGVSLYIKEDAMLGVFMFGSVPYENLSRLLCYLCI